MTYKILEDKVLIYENDEVIKELALERNGQSFKLQHPNDLDISEVFEDIVNELKRSLKSNIKISIGFNGYFELENGDKYDLEGNKL